MLALTLCLFAPAIFGSPAAPVLQEELINEAYSFKITPDKDTRAILTREQVVGTNPDALAGIQQGNGLWAFIIAEYAPNQDLDSFIELIATSLADNVAAENPIYGEVQQVEHRGLPARAQVMELSLNELALRYRLFVYAKDDYVFQIFAWGEEALTSERHLAEITERFDVLPTPVTGSRGRMQLNDADGVGWRQREGVFESALIGVRLEPKGPWRVVVGPELNQVSDTADVGLIVSEPDTYCTVTVYEGIDPSDESLVANCNRAWAEDREAEPIGDAIEMGVLGTKVSLLPYAFNVGISMRFLHGCVVVGNSLFEIDAWSVEATADEAFKALPEALAGLSLLEDKERSNLEAELLRSMDPEFALGEGFALREGTYTDYLHGFSVTKPKEFWHFRAGAEARASGDAVRLAAHKLESDLLVFIEAAPSNGVDQKTAHATSLVEGWGLFDSADDIPPVREVEIGGRSFTTTELWFPGGDRDDFVTLRVMTAVVDGKRYELAARSDEAGVGAYEGSLAALWGSVSFDVPAAIDVDSKRYRDAWIGFELRSPGDGWKGSKVDAPASLKTRSSGYLWKSGRKSFVVIGCGLGEGENIDGLLTPMLDHLVRDAGGKRTEESGSFQGEPVNFVKTKGLFSRGLFMILKRNGRFFVVACRGSRKDDLLGMAERCLEILD